MRISYNWLKEYVDFQKSPEELANDLSNFGFTLESLKKVGNDFVLDLEINPNRGDCLSILGIAREVAALYGLQLTANSSRLKIKEENIGKEIKITVSKPEICPRYTARIIDNVKLAESPEWIKERLISYGFRPLNTIVDITNYVMIATGQPLHAFDFDKIKNGQMIIEQANGSEELVTLDGQKKTLSKGTIIIRDEDKIFDLAGIMGGKNSEVDENTKTIVLQGAIFDPKIIRRSSKSLNHITDASYRYERGVDYEGTIAAVDMAAQIICKLNPAVKIGTLVDHKFQPRNETKIPLNYKAANDNLGIELSEQEINIDLLRLNFKKENNDFLIPSFRQFDVKIWQDLAEEIARIYGYQNIPTKDILEHEAQSNLEWQKRQVLSDKLVELGFSQIISNSFITAREAEVLLESKEDLIEIANPLAEETRFLRSSLISSILRQISRNPWAPEIAVFEIGVVFAKDEKWQCRIAQVGAQNLIKDALNKLKVNVEPQKIEQNILQFYKIRRPVFMQIIDLDKIDVEVQDIETADKKFGFREISKFAPTVRDLAFVVGKNISAEDISKTIKESAKEIFLVELFDEFSSEKLGINMKNLAYHIWMQDTKKPMDAENVEKIIKQIINNIEQKFDAKLRS